MKKKLLSILVVIAMVVAMLPALTITAFADGESNWSKLRKAMNGEAQTTVDGVFKVEDIGDVRTITLLSDITAGTSDKQLWVYGGNKIVLDLNGHVLKGREGIRIIDIANSGTELTLMDSNKESKHTGDFSDLPAGGVITGGNTPYHYGAGINVDTNATFIMTGGTISNNTAGEYGGGVYAYEGTHVFLGGTACIRENFAGGIESNIHLENSNKDIVKVCTDMPLTSGADIGLTIWTNGENWKPGTVVDSYLGETMNDDNYRYFVMNNSGYTNMGTVYSIVKNSEQYVLADSFSVTRYESEHGKVVSEKRNYTNGETVTLTVTLEEGYQLKADSLKATYKDNDQEKTCKLTKGEGNTYTFAMPKATVTVKAEFELIPQKHDVTAQVQGSHGKATVVNSEKQPLAKAVKDTELTFIATPNSGYEFDYWEVVEGGITLTKTDKVKSTLKVKMPDEDLTLKAHFKESEPEIIKGNDQKVKVGTKEEVSFTSSAPFDTFIKVLVDGKEITKDKDYTVKAGSTIVTLKAEYVATLKAGEHKVEIVSEGGTATAKLTITTDAPATADANNMLLWVVIALAAISLTTCTVLRVKRTNK